MSLCKLRLNYDILYAERVLVCFVPLFIHLAPFGTHGEKYASNDNNLRATSHTSQEP